VDVVGENAVLVIRDGKMPFKSSTFKGSRTDKKGGVARFDNSQNVKMRGLLSSVGGGFFFYQKTDFLFLRLRWRHKLSDCVEDYLELCVVFAL